jgi:hypothetical protein
LEFATLSDAIATMHRCDPEYPAWHQVRAGVIDQAMLACRLKFKAALNG